MRIHAIFDGKVFRPEETAALEENKRYLLTVEDDPVKGPAAEHLLTCLAELSVDLGIEDLAEHHREYARQRQR